MIEAILGAVIGGSVTFLVAAMVVAGSRQQIVINKGTSVTYKNSRDQICSAVVHQNVRIGDDYAILKNGMLPMPFVVDIDNVTES